MAMSYGVAFKLSCFFRPCAIPFFQHIQSHFVHVRSIFCVWYFLSLTDMYLHIYFAHTIEFFSCAINCLGVAFL